MILRPLRVFVPLQERVAVAPSLFNSSSVGVHRYVSMQLVYMDENDDDDEEKRKQKIIKGGSHGTTVRAGYGRVGERKKKVDRGRWYLQLLTFFSAGINK